MVNETRVTLSNEKKFFPEGIAGTGNAVLVAGLHMIKASTAGAFANLGMEDFIYEETNDQLLRIKRKIDNDTVEVFEAPTTSFTGAWKYIKRTECFTQVSYDVVTGPATINGQSRAEGSSDLIESNLQPKKRVYPVLVDATSSKVVDLMGV